MPPQDLWIDASYPQALTSLPISPPSPLQYTEIINISVFVVWDYCALYTGLSTPKVNCDLRCSFLLLLSESLPLLRNPQRQTVQTRKSAARAKCHSTTMPSAAFLKFWRTDLTRDCFLSYTTNDDRQSLRLVCHEFSQQVAPCLFSHIKISFGTNTFTRLARMDALEGIGHHVKSASFDMPHTSDTFLAPLLDPVTGEERVFIYEPQIALHRPASSDSRSSVPKYGSWEMNDLLVKQYPPIFHAATNIPSFIRAFNAMPSLRHLRISCPGQSSSQRYRRNAVDYALISLRIALEKASLPDLDTLSLYPVHPAAVLYLRPQFGVGTSPASTRRWRQIKKLTIEMDSFPFGADCPSEHLKLLHSYLRCFQSLEHFTFRWRGFKGPSPLSLSTEPCILSLAALQSSKACPKTSIKPPFPPLKFRKLQSLYLENAVVDASQIAAFVMAHRKILHEFAFEDVHLRLGTWDDALSPLTRISGNEDWKKKQEEVMDVPLMLSPLAGVVSTDCVAENMWEDEKKRNRALQTLRKASLRTKEMLGAGPEHLRRLLRSSVFTWR